MFNFYIPLIPLLTHTHISISQQSVVSIFIRTFSSCIFRGNDKKNEWRKLIKMLIHFSIQLNRFHLWFRSTARFSSSLLLLFLLNFLHVQFKNLFINHVNYKNSIRWEETTVWVSQILNEKLHQGLEGMTKVFFNFFRNFYFVSFNI
jgi:hypothetical protein